jgi:type IV pilus assembly protein PilY1
MRQLCGAVALALWANTLLAQAIIPSAPMSVRLSAKPMVMLVASKEHRLFHEAYNDASDIDGDGEVDIRFKPTITYVGLFHSDYCYAYEPQRGNRNLDLFRPAGRATLPQRTCSGPANVARWSGNWLNYLTTSRIDALRVILYGGMREVDTATETILRRAYIPQDGHSWAKEYTSPQVDGYDIADYTPFPQPTQNRRHFFGNMTRHVSDCTTLSSCSNRPPQLLLIRNSNLRVWDWASSETPVLGNLNPLQDDAFTVRVRVCSTGFLDGCKAYGTAYKPVGLLHEFGEADTLLFGLLTGSYDQNLSGGRLRKVVSSFKDEIDSSTGQFKPDAAIVGTFNALRIRDFSHGSSRSYRNRWISNRAPNEAEFPDWGNPIGEMMFEALRYFAGSKSASVAFSGRRTIDNEVGLPTPSWDDPYAADSAAKAPSCARANLMVISDVNLSYDSDQVPGAFAGFARSASIGTLQGFNAASEASAITEGEPGAAGDHFIGQSGTLFDAAPTAKTVESLGSVRGLAPEEPTKQGSYYAAAAAYFGKRSDLRPDKLGRQNVETFVVALASPLPRIVVPLSSGRKISLIPFAKAINDPQGVRDSVINPQKGAFQPTNPIVDLYIEKIANSGPADANPDVNEGRYYAQFRVMYDTNEQGGDYEMDVAVLYTVVLNANDSVTVSVRPIYQAGSPQHRIGYVISGTQTDGIYLEVQDEADETPYFLNTPPGMKPGACDVAVVPDACKRLPYLREKPQDDPRGVLATATRTFLPGTFASASLLKDPLWYAAKWGAFKDSNANDKPDLAKEWDEDGDGNPDTYMPVVNPLRLREALRRTLGNILARSSSASGMASNMNTLNTRTRVYDAVFETQTWSGDLLSHRLTSSGRRETPPAWQASQALPAWQERKIFVRNLGGSVGAMTPERLTGTTPEIVNFHRGDRSQEKQNGGALRDRNNPLGDIVHVTPVHDDETDTVYISANDGKLHALRASDGRELFAFIPAAAVARLPQLTVPGYTHQYLLDGEIARAPRGPLTNNQRYLYALLGRGGKGLFSLNVTEPAAFGASDALWEYSSASASGGANDADLGLMLGQPIVAALNNGRLGLIVGNGYNSTSGQAVLYVFIIAPDGSLEAVRKIDTLAGDGNGLSGPAALDTNRDGKVDVVYAGDLKGNVWKFDLQSTNPQDWRVGLSGRSLFQARGPAGTPQAITANLSAAIHDRHGDPNFGKRFVLFGTGAFFREQDPTDLSVQSWYGLIDEDTPISQGRSALRERTFTATGIVAEKSVRGLSRASPDDMRDRKGWYLDLGADLPGERIISKSQIIQFAVPTLSVISIYPENNDPCVGGGGSAYIQVDPFTGGSLAMGVIDLNANGDFADDLLRGNVISSISLGVGLAKNMLLLSSGTVAIGSFIGSGALQSSGAAVGEIRFNRGTRAKRRIAWREIIRD